MQGFGFEEKKHCLEIALLRRLEMRTHFLSNHSVLASRMEERKRAKKEGKGMLLAKYLVPIGITALFCCCLRLISMRK